MKSQKPFAILTRAALVNSEREKVVKSREKWIHNAKSLPRRLTLGKMYNA
ncbi:hypothetical protein TUM17567_03370 [Citrobacter amalonaticus]|nr:hypothetical protein TUM17567_03370 [Citrobacter amalonaticus]